MKWLFVLLCTLSLVSIQISPTLAAKKRCPGNTSKSTCVAKPNCKWVQKVSRCVGR